MKPPGSVIIPQVVVGSGAFLPAGQCRYLLHLMSWFGVHDIAIPEKQNAHADDIGWA
jgi:hypothetical protein